MHELSLACEIVDYAHKVAADNGAHSIASITVAVGEASGADPAALQAAFECARNGTLAEPSELKITLVPAGFTCTQCEFDFRNTELEETCPVCGAPAVLTMGHNIVIRSMRFETSDEAALKAEKVG